MYKDSGPWSRFGFLIVILVFSLNSCKLLSLLVPGPEDEETNQQPTLSQEIVELAEGIFGLIGSVFENIDDPLNGDYPVGMSVSSDDPETELILTLDDFSPPDDSLVLANGEITLTRTSIDPSPLTIVVVGTLTLSNHTFSTVSLDGSAVWAAADSDPAVDQPESFAGTFTVDGVEYQIADIIAAMEEDDDTNPVVCTPLPTLFMTSAGNYSQDFKAKVWRPGPALTSDRWCPYEYISFSISEDGTSHTYYAGDETPKSGCLDWYSDEDVQKLDMLDGNGDALVSFTVLDYSSCHLHLRGQWGAETLEWIFSAGKDALSGVVVDNNDSVTIGYYPYNKPISGVAVQLGTLSQDMLTFTPVPGATAMTDERGYFEFDDISAYAGQCLGVELTKEGFGDIQSPIPAHRPDPIVLGEQYFEWFGMNPF